MRFILFYYCLKITANNKTEKLVYQVECKLNYVTDSLFFNDMLVLSF